MSIILHQLSTEDDVTLAQTSSDHYVTLSNMFSPATKAPESLSTGALVGIIIGSIFGLLVVSAAALLIARKCWLVILSDNHGSDFVQQEADSKADVSSVANVSTMELCEIRTTVCDCLPVDLYVSPISTSAAALDYSLISSSSDACLTAPSANPSTNATPETPEEQCKTLDDLVKFGRVAEATAVSPAREASSFTRQMDFKALSVNLDNSSRESGPPAQSVRVEETSLGRLSFDDFETASALAAPSVCLSTEDGNAWPDTDRLATGNVRRSYRLDSSSALAIAAQRNRDSSVYDADKFATVGEVVIVYNERTSL